MAAPEVHLFLPAHLARDHAAGRSNILSRLLAVFDAAGWQVHHHADGPDAAARARRLGGYALLHMQEPEHARALCLRRAYHYPFWRIEATNARWNFDVARAGFDPSLVPDAAARAFYRRWRERLLGQVQTRRGGYIYMPLQGRLAETRSFQSVSPLQMIGITLSSDLRRKLRATLHPNEVYDPQDMEALEYLAQQCPRFELVDTASPDLLTACDYVVTQNSTLALTGYFARKAAVLFSGSDFHHIAGSVPRQGIAAAFATAQGDAPDYAAYLYWFFQMNSINAHSDGAVDAIRARMARHGWPM